MLCSPSLSVRGWHALEPLVMAVGDMRPRKDPGTLAHGSIPPNVVSELAEAFPPPHVQHPELVRNLLLFVATTGSGGEDDGAKATILAFALILEVRSTPTGQCRSPAAALASDAQGF